MMDMASREQLRRLDETVGETAAWSSRGGTDDLGRALHLMATVDRLNAYVVELVGRAQATSAAEQSEGLPLLALMQLKARRTYGDARTLESLAQTLVHMPGLAAAFAQGVVSFGEVRKVCWQAKNLTVDELGWLDEQLCADRDRMSRMGADELVEAAGRLVDRCRPEQADKQQKDAYERRFLAVQPALDGSAAFTGELDAEGAATLLEAVEAAAERNTSARDDETPCDRHGQISCERCQNRPSMGQRRADGLVDVCDHYLSGNGGDGGGGGPARPSLILVADAQLLTGTPDNGDGQDGGGGNGSGGGGGPHGSDPDNGDAAACRCGVKNDVDGHGAHATAMRQADSAGDVTGSETQDSDDAALGELAVRPVDPSRDVDVEPFGQLLWRGPGGPVRLPAETVRRLACDSDYQMVLRHRGRIVGVVSSRRMVDPTRRASLVARDRHCRFPGCRAPASKCVAHHVVFWPDGTTTIVNLVLLCRHHHRLVHHGGWILRLEPDGTCQFRRGRRRYVTHPGEHLRPRPSRPPPGRNRRPRSGREGSRGPGGQTNAGRGQQPEDQRRSETPSDPPIPF